ncbi:MAG TPA: hypothetical protein PKW48_11815, partial [Deltaproteobacteria bacterium]|nr:hypothetical protein [Deltaproteobacteria bacterium]
MALLFLSLGVLAGASVLFSTISARPEFSYDPFGQRWRSLMASDSKQDTEKTPKTEIHKGSASGFEYSYWDILLLQDNNTSSADDSFSIQIAA